MYWYEPCTVSSDKNLIVSRKNGNFSTYFFLCSRNNSGEWLNVCIYIIHVRNDSISFKHQYIHQSIFANSSLYLSIRSIAKQQYQKLKDDKMRNFFAIGEFLILKKKKDHSHELSIYDARVSTLIAARKLFTISRVAGSSAHVILIHLFICNSCRHPHCFRSRFWMTKMKTKKKAVLFILQTRKKTNNSIRFSCNCFKMSFRPMFIRPEEVSSQIFIAN